MASIGLPHTRRSFLAGLASMPFAIRSMAEPMKAAKWVFLGTDAGAGIYRCTWNEETGKLGEPELAVSTLRPNFLTLHPHLNRMYAVNAVSGAAAAVSSFRLDRSTGSLEAAGHQSSRGDGPCFVSIDATGRSAFVADYAGGSFAAYQLAVDGALLPATGTLHCKGTAACGAHGPNHDRQDGSHPHCATLSPDNGFVLVCDLGNDVVDVFNIRPESATPLGPLHSFPTRPGSGPRHVAFHPNGHWLYVLHELDCTLQVFDWTVTGGVPHLAPRENSVLSTLRADAATTGNTACEIIVSPDGRFAYASTRGVDEVTVYRIDPHSGLLTEQQRIACGGKTPRHMAFDPTHRWLLSANQAAPGTVTVFAHDPGTGRLTGPVQTVSANTPMFVQFV